MQPYDIVRSLATNIMLVMLLFTLAKPKLKKPGLWITFALIIAIDAAINTFFYLRDDYTTLAIADIVYFIVVGFAIKCLFKDSFLQWLFNMFTVMNVYAIVVVLSYYLCGFFPYPSYSITILRVILFAVAIILFRRQLRPLYRQAAEHWSIYLLVAAALFLYFAYYFVRAEDVEQTLVNSVVPLLLLTLVTLVTYLTMFLSLKKTLREATLREENLKIQSDRKLTKARLSLMDETVRQMSIAQHDRRHFNNTLLALLQQNETDKAIELICKQSESLPNKPHKYCENMPVNAAVSYYTELAVERSIRCNLRLDIPEKLSVDELSLAMVVSNLMENAITAVSVLPVEKRELHFTAVYSGQLVLEMVNPYEGKVTLDGRGIPVSAKDGHGRGSQSVFDFVNKCGGELVYETTGNVFKVRMML